jgi:hypothetical protein
MPFESTTRLAAIAGAAVIVSIAMRLASAWIERRWRQRALSAVRDSRAGETANTPVNR